MKRDVKVEVVPITDLQPDPNNANTGTERGLMLLDDSLQQLGAGRSVLADRHGVLMAGNKTHQRAVELGYQEAVVVHTDGRQLVVVQRDDLDLETDPRARRMAISDNRVGEIDLQWSPEMLAAIAKEQPEALAGLWTESEMADLLGEEGGRFDRTLDEIDLERLPVKPIWCLLAVPFSKMADVQPLLDQIAELGIQVEVSSAGRPK